MKTILKHLTAKKRADIENALRDGMKSGDVAEKFSVSLSTVFIIRKEVIENKKKMNSEQINEETRLLLLDIYAMQVALNTAKNHSQDSDIVFFQSRHALNSHKIIGKRLRKIFRSVSPKNFISTSNEK